MDNNLCNILTKIAVTEPLDPRGWFRWLHNHYLGRYGSLHQSFLDDGLDSELWSQLQDKPVPLYKRVNNEDLLLDIVNRHAWSMGIIRLKDTVLALWDKMEPLSRSAFLSAMTERGNPDPYFNMLVTFTNHLEYSPESFCQLACNTIASNRTDILEHLLKLPFDVTASIQRFPTSGSFDNWEHEVLEKLSHRVIDMILEAALIWNRVDSARLALQHGADPDIPIWQLERSCNHEYSALGYSIASENMYDSKPHQEMIELLLEYGANPAGIPFAGVNHELYIAIGKDWDDFAERLIIMGAKLARPVPPEEDIQAVRTAGSEFLILGSNDPNFGHLNNTLDWAHNVIGKIIPLVSVAEKQAYFNMHSQGGEYSTALDKVIGDLERLKRFEALGLDTRLTAEEFCTAVRWNASEGLGYLLSKHGDDVSKVVFAAIKEHKPEFGRSKDK